MRGLPTGHTAAPARPASSLLRVARDNAPYLVSRTGKLPASILKTAAVACTRSRSTALTNFVSETQSTGANRLTESLSMRESRGASVLLRDAEALCSFRAGANVVCSARCGPCTRSSRAFLPLARRSAAFLQLDLTNFVRQTQNIDCRYNSGDCDRAAMLVPSNLVRRTVLLNSPSAGVSYRVPRQPHRRARTPGGGLNKPPPPSGCVRLLGELARSRGRRGPFCCHTRTRRAPLPCQPLLS